MKLSDGSEHLIEPHLFRSASRPLAVIWPNLTNGSRCSPAFVVFHADLHRLKGS